MRVTGAYFCSYDDFIELHRAAFEDSADHSRIVTTSHFGSYRYRPLNRLANFLTYRAGEFNAKWFRTKNLAFHLLNIILIYLLSWILFESVAISATAALLFGLHPVANQTIIGAVDTNSMSHAAAMAALVMLMRSMRSSHWATWLTASVLSAWLGLLGYDSNIVIFGLMLVWLFLKWMTVRECVNYSRILTLFGILSGSLLTIYFVVRHLYIPQDFRDAASTVPPAFIILKNALMYIGSLVLPVDVVLANVWLNTPLPSEVQFTESPLIVIALATASIGFGILLLRWVKAHASEAKYIAIVFLLMGIGLPLVPVLLLQSHPSETYLYLPLGFYSILLSFGLVKITEQAGGLTALTLYLPAIGVLIVLFAAATWLRNERVFDCGQAARRILHALPETKLRQGPWKVFFANSPGDETTRRYGFYGFRGVDTIGHGGIANTAVTSALQLVYKNELLTGEVVEPQQVLAKCHNHGSASHICVMVASDGRIEITSATSSERISTR